jgi:hypothetical protein
MNEILSPGAAFKATSHSGNTWTITGISGKVALYNTDLLTLHFYVDQHIPYYDLPDLHKLCDRIPKTRQKRGVSKCNPGLSY